MLIKFTIVSLSITFTATVNGKKITYDFGYFSSNLLIKPQWEKGKKSLIHNKCKYFHRSVQTAESRGQKVQFLLFAICRKNYAFKNSLITINSYWTLHLSLLVYSSA